MLTLWIISAISAYLVYYIINFYVKVYRLPRGPFPLPLIGNLPVFVFGKQNKLVRISKALANYDSISTLWMGNTPVIFINDLEIAKKAFNNHDFLGRPGDNVIKKLVMQNIYGKDILFSDASPTWASLRKVGHTALRKSYSNESLPILVSEVVDETIISLKSEIGIGYEFDPSKYVQMIITKIMAFSVFGKRFFKDDKEFSHIMACFRKIIKHFDELILADFVPILFAIKYRTYVELLPIFAEVQKAIRESYDKHLIDVKNGEIENICDALIDSKRETLSDNKESADHLDDANLRLVLFNMFTAGIETTKYTTRWLLLFMANYPEMQQTMREEIAQVIGDRIAMQRDKHECHFTNAFISEVLRHRNVAPIGIPHKTTRASKLANYIIPQDSVVVSFMYYYMHDPKQWQNPETFDPTRFLVNGKFNSKINSHFVPFGVGKRVCLGEKMALNNLFYLLVRIIQSTAGMTFVLAEGPGSADFEPNDFLTTMTAKKYKLILKAN